MEAAQAAAAAERAEVRLQRRQADILVQQVTPYHSSGRSPHSMHQVSPPVALRRPPAISECGPGWWNVLGCCECACQSPEVLQKPVAGRWLLACNQCGCMLAAFLYRTCQCLFSSLACMAICPHAGGCIIRTHVWHCTSLVHHRLSNNLFALSCRRVRRRRPASSRQSRRRSACRRPPKARWGISHAQRPKNPCACAACSEVMRN